MKAFRMFLLGSAFLLLDTGVSSVEAAWNNVFQVCCHHPRPVVSAYAMPCPPAPCPPPVQFVQRSFYEPVVTYQTRMYFEAVTTQQTSYFYEPVTSYRYSCYFDPCTCSFQQVAVPTISHRLRAQTCPVTSWVQRCMTVPVTTMRQSFYWEPVNPCPPGVPAPAPSPGVSEQRLAPVPGVSEQPGRTNGSGTTIERYYEPPMPPASGSSTRPAPTAPPTVRLDRIVALPPAHNVEGQVIRGDSAPQAGARLLFVSTARQGVRQTTQADAAGQFRLTLGSGEWLVYLHGADGKPVFHSKLEVRENEPRKVALVSR